MPDPSPRQSARGKRAVLARYRTDDDPEYIATRQHLHILGLEEHIQKVLAAAPALTSEQRAKLAELLKPVAS